MMKHCQNFKHGFPNVQPYCSVSSIACVSDGQARPCL